VSARSGVGPSDSTASEAPQASSAADPRRWVALAVIAAATLMVVLDTSIVNLALPRAQADLGMSDATRAWVVTAYTVAFGGLLLLGGRIGDLLGRKRMFLIGMIGFAVASAVGGFAATAGVLFAARAAQGAFAALLAPAALSLVSVTFVEPAERAKAFAVYGAVSGGGGAVGLILGGLLTEYASWRWCLLVNVPIALLAAAAAVVTVPRDTTAMGPRHYDVAGALTATAASIVLVYGLTVAGEGAGWLSPAPVALLVAAAVLLVTFVMLERRNASPLLPLRVVTDRLRGGSFITSALISAGMFAMFLFLAYYLQGDLGLDPLLAGLAILPFSGGIITAAAAAARLLPRYGPRLLMVAGMAAATVGMGWLVLLSASSGYWLGVSPSMLVMGVGLGLVFVPLSSVALTGVEPADAGVASALLNATQQVGGAVGVALLNTLYTASLATTAPGTTTMEAHLAGYRLTFAVATGLFAAALVVIAMATRQRAPRTTAAEHA
jgi:EmrB/QacA subfamily drug resistance transporter